MIQVENEIGMLFDKKTTVDTIRVSNYTFICKHEVAGTDIMITCISDKPETPNAGILKPDEGMLIDGKWKSGRRLNGDQGRHIRIPAGNMAFRS